MGHWEGPDDTEALMRIYDKLDPYGIVMEPDHFIRTLTESGLLIRAAYYVPDTKELLGLMRELQYHLRRGNVGCRWVMCRETVDALARQYKQQRVPQPLPFDADFWRGAGAELPSAALELEYTTVMESRTYWSSQDRLFGVPIRIDPAARSPLFEVDSDATRTRWP